MYTFTIINYGSYSKCLHYIFARLYYAVRNTSFVNPLYGCGVKITSDITPIYDALERSCPKYSKNVSYVDVRLV